jgi:hypothetical protein
MEISENTNAQTVKLFRIMKILCALQIVLGIFMIFIDVMSGIWMLFAALLFVLVIWMKNWCMSVMYIIFCMMDMLTSIVMVGNYFSHTDPGSNSSIYAYLYMVKFPFFLIVIYYSFLTYRELKGLYIEGCANGGLENYGTVANRAQPQRNEPPVDHIQPFQGTGYRLG